MVDGPGFRTSIYCAGCPNHCPGCHNPQSWDISHGTMTSTDELMKEIMSDPFANVTFSGGDPMFQAKGFAELARAIREQSSKSIWCGLSLRKPREESRAVGTPPPNRCIGRRPLRTGIAR